MVAKGHSQWNCTIGGKRRRLVSTFSCEICDSTFKTQSDVKIHQRNKHGGNQWKCKICAIEMKYSRSDLGKYNHLCEKRLARKRSLFTPGFIPVLDESE